jgi:beta-glucosidase
MKRQITFSMLLFITTMLFSQEPNDLKLTKDNIKEIIASMTTEEKVFMVIGHNNNEWKKYIGVGSTWQFKKLGITPILLDDGPAGVRIKPKRPDDSKTYYCTAFPTATSLAATWNVELVEHTGNAMGKELLEYGSDVLLAPAVNIHRNPLNGRNFEYYSEDPVLSGKMGAAMVRGVQSNGVGTSVKHFVANNQESNRKGFNAVISQRALREIYLRSFEIVVRESQPWTIMSSYNRLNGFFTAENKDLLTTVLRDEWGFKGVVMTDWVSANDAVAMMKAGNDLIMPGYHHHNAQYHYDDILSALKDKTLDEEVIDQNVERILQLVVKTPRFKKFQYTSTPDLQAHAKVSQESANEAMVLLKNNGILPLKKIENIALFGKTSYDFITGGTGSGEVNYQHAISLLEGLDKGGYKVSKQLESFYKNMVDSIFENSESHKKFAVINHPEIPLNKSEIQNYSRKTDVAIITIGRISGEGYDRNEKDYFNLTDIEHQLISDVCEIFHAAKKKVIVVLNIGGVIETDSWKHLPDAILLAWQTGQQGGAAVTDILKGDVNPSGKLPMTYPKVYADVPSSKTFPGIPVENPINSFYNEGIYVGYRYYDSFNIPTSYEFGYGLSYTNFEYADINTSSDIFNDSIVVSVTIRNTGKRAGKEVVQLYIAAPKLSLDKPLKELKGFTKTRLLNPGESQQISFKLDSKLLASFWSSKSSWIADKGTYEVLVGASSKDIRQKTSFSLPAEIQVEQLHDVLYPNFMIKDLGTGGEKILRDRSPFGKFLDLFYDFMWYQNTP